MAERLKSGIKRKRQNAKRRAHNTNIKSDLKTQLKKHGAAVESNNPDEITSTLRETESKLKKAASKGIFHKKTAARKVSRLAKAAARASSNS